MTEGRKEWVEPELMVLVRSKPEEAVLGACKLMEISAGSENGDAKCGTLSCAPCDMTTGS